MEGLIRGYIEIMEVKMEATIHGLALWGLRDIVPVMEHQIKKKWKAKWTLQFIQRSYGA